MKFTMISSLHGNLYAVEKTIERHKGVMVLIQNHLSW